MNGWTRLGIVITVIYIFVGVGFGTYGYLNELTTVPKLQASSIFVKYEKITPVQLEKVIKSRASRYRLCLAKEFDKVICGGVHKFEPNFIKTPNVAVIITFLIVLPTLFWLLVWACWFVGLWVRKGFRPKDK